MGGPVTAVALSQARARLSPGVLEALFTAGARPDPGDLPGLRTFGLVVTAVAGTVVDLPATDPVRVRFATPAGGRFPQARLVTLVVCGTRRILGAVTGSCAVAEPELRDRLAGHLAPGTLNLADRGYFSLRRWHTATGTGAQLIWRVKNGTRSLPARILATLPDGSVLVVLRESDAMRCARRNPGAWAVSGRGGVSAATVCRVRCWSGLFMAGSGADDWFGRSGRGPVGYGGVAVCRCGAGCVRRAGVGPRRG